MLNVVSLRRRDAEPPTEKPIDAVSKERNHVLKRKANTGRLSCGEDLDTIVPPLDIYGAR